MRRTDHLFDFRKRFLFASSVYGGYGNYVSHPRFQGGSDAHRALFYPRFREFIAFGGNNRKRKLPVIQKIDHRKIVRRRRVPNIRQGKYVRDVFSLRKKIVQQVRPLLLFRLGNAREAVSRKIGQNKFAEIEIIDQSRAPRLTALPSWLPRPRPATVWPLSSRLARKILSSSRIRPPPSASSLLWL